jgi:hypothetical protein
MSGRCGPAVLLIALAAMGCAPAPLAPEAPSGGSTASLPPTPVQPLRIGAGPAAEPAPVPNREIEAPPDRFSDPMAPRIEPMMMGRDRPQGVTFGGEHLREVAPDRSLENVARLPLDDILPGARVRIPFE